MTARPEQLFLKLASKKVKKEKFIQKCLLANSMYYWVVCNKTADKTKTGYQL